MRSPVCPECGSDHIVIAGSTTFRWRNGKWREERGVAEMSDGGQFHCRGCFEVFTGDLDPPFNLRKETPLIGERF